MKCECCGKEDAIAIDYTYKVINKALCKECYSTFNQECCKHAIFILSTLCDIPECKGTYDAKAHSPEFIDGVALVMQTLASRVNEDYYDQFLAKFLDNLIDSQIEAGMYNGPQMQKL